MSHLFTPRHKAPHPRRLLAVGGAAAITTLTIGGALGIGPGAAMGDENRRPAASEPTGQDTVDESADQAGTETGDGQPGGNGGGGWLNVEDDATTAPERGDDTDEAATLPDPEVPADSGSGTRVVFDMSAQRVWLVDDEDEAIRTYLVSGSKHDNLEPGEYAVYSKSMDAVSFNHEETMQYMVRFAHGVNAPIGFHDIPRYDDGSKVQTQAELGQALSAGCIRQAKADAKALWDFAEVETPVVVVA